MGQNETVTTAKAGSSTLRRMLLALLVAALLAATMAASALPAMADMVRDSGDSGRPSMSGDLDGQGKGSDAFHYDDGICVSHVGGGKVAGTSNGRGC